jgi:hypothetical protein
MWIKPISELLEGFEEETSRAGYSLYHMIDGHRLSRLLCTIVLSSDQSLVLVFKSDSAPCMTLNIIQQYIHA